MTAAAALLLTGCQTNISWYRMNLDVEAPGEGKFLNLADQTTKMDLELKRQVETILAAAIDHSGEEYGYYTVNFFYDVDVSGGGLFLAGFSGATCFIFNLLGMPWTIYDYGLYGRLRIFDSQGNVAGTFEYSRHFNKAAGFYYGDPTGRAGRYYSELLSDLLRQAERRRDQINESLRQAGPVTRENAAAAQTNIQKLENQSRPHPFRAPVW